MIDCKNGGSEFLRGQIGKRRLVLWVPEWIVEDKGDERGVVGVSGSRVVQASYQAIQQGIRIGDSLAKAQLLCPDIEVVASQAKERQKDMERYLRIFERSCPHVEKIKDGLGWAVLSSNISAVEETILLRDISESITYETGKEVWLGVANGMAAAAAAARRNLQLPQEETPEFLRHLSVRELIDFLPARHLARYEGLLEVFSSVGINSVGELQRLSRSTVQNRFGKDGTSLWILSFGGDIALRSSFVTTNAIEVEQVFSGHITTVEQILIPLKSVSARLCDRLCQENQKLVRLLVVLVDSEEQVHQKTWYLSQGNDSAEITKRIVWQIKQWSSGFKAGSDEISAASLESVRLVVAESTSLNDSAVWGSSTDDDRVTSTADRLQMMLGKENVKRPVIRGGRNPRERLQWVQWGDVYPQENPPGAWEGAINEAPLIFFDVPVPVKTLGVYAKNVFGPIWVSPRGTLNGTISKIIVEENQEELEARTYKVESVIGPWVHTKRWWEWKDTNPTRCFIRVRTAEKKDILLMQVAKGWYAEGLYVPTYLESEG